MSTLHPSNPYYTHPSQHPDKSPQAIPETSRPTPPKRSQSDTPATSSSQPPERRTSSTPTYRTRSIAGPFSAGVIFERQIDLSPPTDDEIIITTVRITNPFRRASLEGSSELPSRPPPRSFLRRISTRLSSPHDANQYTVIKMPRKDYKSWFARDREGKYVGSEPEREWTVEDLEREFGAFQEMPLRSIPGRQEGGEGEGRGGQGLLREGGGSEEECAQTVVDGEVQGVRRVDGVYML